MKLLPLVLLASPVAPQEASAPRDLGPVLEEVLAGTEVPGIGGAVVTSEGLVALGVAGVRERGSDAKIQRDDLFHIGSCTKSMTATLLAMSVEAEKLRWDTTIAEGLPDLAKAMDEAWLGATLTQLLAHTAGMPENLLDYGNLGLAFLSRTKPMPMVRRKAVEGICAKPPLAQPGTAYLYSNFGYVTAGAMLERIEEKPWEELIRARLLEPLGMASAGFGPPEAPYFVEQDDAEPEEGQSGARQPRGHFPNGKVAKRFDNPPALGPAGTVHCTLADWAKYVRLHLRGARGEEGLLLKPETFAELHTPEPGTSYGFGWVHTERPWSQGEILMHDGSNMAWFAYLWMAPEEDFAVLVSCNRGGAAGQEAADAAAWRLIQGMVAEGDPGETRGD